MVRAASAEHVAWKPDCRESSEELIGERVEAAGVGSLLQEFGGGEK